jgi:hypothetical protein
MAKIRIYQKMTRIKIVQTGKEETKHLEIWNIHVGKSNKIFCP